MSESGVLVTGPTGYIGGRLVPRLLEAGYAVRCLARDPDRLRGKSWTERVEVIRGDALNYDSFLPAVEGCSAGYYLIHSRGAGEDRFANRDRRAAEQFGRVAR